MRADRADITSPRDLDGKIYGGFGGPARNRRCGAVIQAAGGRGEFTTVVLGTAAYEALYAGQVDFTEPFVAWEGIEAELRGRAAAHVRLHRLRLPGRLRRAADRQLALAGRAPRRGARSSCRPPSAATSSPPTTRRRRAQLLHGRQPRRVHRARAGQPQPGRCSAADYLRDESGRGRHADARALGGLLRVRVRPAATLTGPDGAPLAERPDFATWFTNDYLAP